ncbi:MAG: spore germination protein [Firmicutes bacterium]|nr:spore germination protein [Bacillota bacterium]
MKIPKISNHQLFSLTACNSIGVALIAISALMASIAKQDAWISALITPVFGMLVMLIYWLLGSKYPNMSFVDIIKTILGKWLGLLVGSLYVFFYTIIGCHLPWYIGQFTTISALPETPPYIISLLFMIAVVIAELYGIEAIARASEIFIILISVLFFLAMLLVSPNAKIENLKPIFEHGITPILKSSIFLACFTTFHLITLMGIYPYNIANISEAKKSILKGYLFGGIIIFVTIIMSLLVLGENITSKIQYPTYVLAKEINIVKIFTRLEFLIALVWIVAIFVIGVLFFHAAVISLSEVLGLKDHRRIIIPLGLIMLVLSEVILPDIPYYANWINLVWIPYSITIGLIIPVLLLLVYSVKKKIFKINKVKSKPCL